MHYKNHSSTSFKWVNPHQNPKYGMVGAIRGPMLDHELDHFLVIIKDKVSQSLRLCVCLRP